MRIAILNLQYDNNYGGNLQRYALITVLQRMGHNVTHLNLRFNYDHLCWYEKLWRYIKRMRRKVFIDRTLRIFPLENDRQKYYEDSCIEVDKFYNKYITHTKALYSKKQLAKQKDFDVADRIKLYYEADDTFDTVIDSFEDMIKKETLSVELIKKNNLTLEFDLNGLNVKLDVERA